MTDTTAPSPEMVDCQFCAEKIMAAAKKCRHCGETLDPAMRRADEALRAAKTQAPVYMNAGGGGGYAQPQLRPWGHVGHIIMTFLTVGFWIPVWIILYLFRNKSVYF